MKPANILFRRKNELECWLSDFGICLVLAEPRQTETSEVVGPRAFMAPEAEAGGPVDLKPSADVYSLGKVIFYMLSGGKVLPREWHRQPPWNEAFQGADPRLGPIGDLLDGMIALLPGRIENDSGRSENALIRILTWGHGQDDDSEQGRLKPARRGEAARSGLDVS